PAIPEASPVSSPKGRSPAISPSPPITRSLNDLREPSDYDMARESKASTTPKKQITPAPTPTKAPASRRAPVTRETLVSEEAELHLFDFTSGTFVLQDGNVQAIVTEVASWKYWLQISGDDQQWLGQEVVPDINPVFNFEYTSFIFNHYTEDGSAYSWLLKFKDAETIGRFQEGLMQALWEHLNQTKWQKAADKDRDYVLDAFNDLVIKDRDDEREAEAAAEDEEDEDDFEDAHQ
ncbi:Vacuolar import and degradation protein 27, partial [Teratosphaeriaceae sp. CCFEE 6253]